MRCKKFRKNIDYLIFDTKISLNLKPKLINHMNNCKECKEYYNEILNTDKLFKIFFKVDIKFNSVRRDVMKYIECDKYKSI